MKVKTILSFIAILSLTFCSMMGCVGGRHLVSHGPIIDTHIHFYQVSKPGGVPWPPKHVAKLYRDILPGEYKKIAQKYKIIGAGVVEANPTMEENFRILELINGDEFFKFFIPSLEIGAPSFAENLEKLAENQRVVGIRGFLWSPELKLDNSQLASLKQLERRGMILEIISRGYFNPKNQIETLAKKLPNLRIIIDHLGGAKGQTPDPQWVDDMQKLAQHQNIYVKFSSFFDMFNPNANEEQAWQSPTELASYQAHFDVLMKNFGANRLIWGSNWPVVDQGGSISQQVAIAEAYLKPFGSETRDKVMYKNALNFYRRAVK